MVTHEANTPRSPRALLARLFAIVCLSSLVGCGLVPLAANPDANETAFDAGELRSTEETPLLELHAAARAAIETLRYEDVSDTLDADRGHFRATTAGGDPVDLRLIARGPKRTELRIRIGVSGSEARSRLVLEQIHQAL